MLQWTTYELGYPAVYRARPCYLWVDSGIGYKYKYILVVNMQNSFLDYLTRYTIPTLSIGYPAVVVRAALCYTSARVPTSVGI